MIIVFCSLLCHRSRSHSSEPWLYNFFPSSFCLPAQSLSLLQTHMQLGGEMDSIITQKMKLLQMDETCTTADIRSSVAKSIRRQQALTEQQFSSSQYPYKLPCHLPSSLLPCSHSPSKPSSQSPFWILKPHNSGSGRGVIITDFIHNVDPTWLSEEYVASR